MNARENMDAVIRGGKTPERFANNYEAIQLLFDPSAMHSQRPAKGEMNVKNAWGVTYSFPENVPGAFPVHTPDKILVPDFEDWKDYVKAPSVDYPAFEWDIFKAQYDAVDKTKSYVGTFVAPGLFEQLHNFGGMENALMAFYECEDDIHDLIKYLTDWELKLAEGICANLKPDALFHHDDWGSMKSTFMSVGMFEDFFVDAYKQIYGYYHDHGVKYVFHHADSYCATLVPDMIEMGIDVWQGCLSTNDLPTLVKKYGEQITFMGGFDGAMVDREDMDAAKMKEIVYKVLDEVGTTRGFIPCIAQGGPGSVYPQVYRWLMDSIDQYSIEKLGAKKEDIEAGRLPLQILF